jgi:hypothetical protein
LLDRRHAGKYAEESVDLGRSALQGREQLLICSAWRVEGGEVDGEVVHRSEGRVSAALVVGEGGIEWSAAVESGRDCRGEEFGLAQRVADSLGGDRVHDQAGVACERPAGVWEAEGVG